MANRPNTKGKRYIIDPDTGRRRLWREEDGEDIVFVPADGSAGVAASNTTNKLMVGCGDATKKVEEEEEES